MLACHSKLEVARSPATLRPHNPGSTIFLSVNGLPRQEAGCSLTAATRLSTLMGYTCDRRVRDMMVPGMIPSASIVADQELWWRWTLWTAAGELVGFAAPALAMAAGTVGQWND